MSRQPDEEPNRDGRLVPEQEQSASDADQSSADVDQTASDRDQTASDVDQSASDRDQLQAEADQRAAESDQVAADRELAASPSDAAKHAHDVSRLARDRTTLERQGTALTRSRVSSERDRQAVRRDEEAQHRDDAALSRDRAADARDDALVELAEGLGLSSETQRKLAVDAAAELRIHAAADRGRAARDRERAATDRERAAQDRRELYNLLEVAHLDDLTGAYRRGIGEIVLRNELERAQRSKAVLTLAMIDADDLKAVNDSRGHAAGDAVLRDIAAAIRESLRTYDPLVRVGGDEFICTIADAKVDDARRRFDGISATLAESQPEISISVGLVAMSPADTLPALVERADVALYQAKQTG